MKPNPIGEPVISARTFSSPADCASIDLRVAALVSAAILAYWPASNALWRYWIEHPYFGAHGILVAAIAAWLLWRDRRRVASVRVRGETWLLLPLFACSICWLLLWRVNAEMMQEVLLPALILLAVWAAFGIAVAREIAVAVGFLYFAMPVWDLLAGPLQTLTLEVVRLALPLMGLPATISGDLISLPDGINFSVTVWCSGQGIMVQGLAVATLLGELEGALLRRRLRLLAGMAILALIINWIRVLIIIQVGYTTGMRHVLVTRYHVLFGYVLYAIALLLFVWVTALTQRPAPYAEPAAPLPAPARIQFLPALLALVMAPLMCAVFAWLR